MPALVLGETSLLLGQQGTMAGNGDLKLLQESVLRLEEQVQQVTREKEELEDKLVEEQLKNKMPQDAQLEAAQNRASVLEMELQAMASKCEEWRRKARMRVGELNPLEVQALLEEHLEDVDHTGVVGLKAEVARLRAELARSEVQRFELTKQLSKSGAPRWESEEEGLEEQIQELSVGVQLSGNEARGSPRWATPQSSILTESKMSSKAESSEGEDLLQLVELGEATLGEAKSTEHMDCLASAREAADARADAAERRCQQYQQRIQELEARLAGGRAGDLPHRGANSSAGESPAPVCANGPQEGASSGDAPADAASPEGGEGPRANGSSPVPNGVLGEGGAPAAVSARGAGSQEDIKELLNKVQAQNKMTHRVLGMILAVPLVIGAWIFFSPPFPQFWRKQGQNTSQGAKDRGASSEFSKAARSGEGLVVLQIAEKAPQERRAVFK